MLDRIERDIWIADGASVSFFGFPYPTRMTIVRLADGSLWVRSRIPCAGSSRRTSLPG